MFLGVYTVLCETTRNPTNTMVKPLDSNCAVAVVERCMSCLVSRSISNIRVDGEYGCLVARLRGSNLIDTALCP